MKKNISYLLKSLIVLIFSILLCLAIGELIVRVRVATKEYFAKKFPWEPYAVSDSSGRRYIPHWDGVCNINGRKYRAHTNSMGLRERELSLGKDDKIYKLLFLGDSITFGIGVEADNTFVRILENLLNMHPQAKSFATINAGVCGAFTFEEINLLKKVGIKYHPDVVVLNFYLNDIVVGSPEDTKENKDEWEKTYFKYKVSMPFKSFLANHSEFYKFLRETYRNLLLEMNLIKVPSTYCGEWGSSMEDNYYEKFGEYIREIKELGDKEGFKLVIVFFPNYFQVSGESLDNVPQKRLSVIAQSESIPFFDLLPVFKAKRKARTFYLDCAHLAPKGHQFVAENIYQFLKNIL